MQELFAYLLLCFIVKLFIKTEKGVLCCGIFGGSARTGKRLNVKKLMALGLYNIQRGTDSCGYFFNGHIDKGVGEESNFGKFVNKSRLIRGNNHAEVFIGHTRKSTMGLNTFENAHPHLVEGYVQAHNGQIKNIRQLCLDYAIPFSEVPVDSIGLAKIIEKTSGFEVLNEYEGYAALAMCFLEKPQELYLYHGATRETKNGIVYEERPLYVLDTAEGLYYSSIEESLDFINENKSNKPQILPHNIVYKIVNGEIGEKVFKTKRATLELNLPYVYVAPPVTYREDIWGGRQAAAKQLTIPLGVSTVVKEQQAVRSISFREKRPKEAEKQDVYYWRGRYYRNDNILLEGMYNIDRDGMIIGIGEESDRVIEQFYFMRGVMMVSQATYEIASEGSCSKEKINLNANVSYLLSFHSKYPVSCAENEGLMLPDTVKYIWYKYGMHSTESYSPKFSTRTYVIRYGKIVDIISKTEDITLNEKENMLFKSVVENEETITTIEQEAITDMVCEVIFEWCERVITKDDIHDIPEIFLETLDEYNEAFVEDPTAEATVEKETSLLLRDLIKSGVSFASLLVTSDDKELVTYAHIANKYRGYTLEELSELESRYSYIDINEGDETEALIDKALASDAKRKADEIHDHATFQEVASVEMMAITRMEEQLASLDVQYKQLDLLDETDIVTDVKTQLFQEIKELSKKIYNKKIEFCPF